MLALMKRQGRTGEEIGIQMIEKNKTLKLALQALGHNVRNAARKVGKHISI